MDIIHPDQIPRLHGAIVALRLSDRRTVLLAGIDPAVIATLPRSEDPSTQILSDLRYLNSLKKRADGSIPIRTWVVNANTLARVVDPDCEVFFKTLQVIDQVGGEEPLGRSDKNVNERPKE